MVDSPDQQGTLDGTSDGENSAREEQAPDQDKQVSKKEDLEPPLSTESRGSARERLAEVGGIVGGVVDGAAHVVKDGFAAVQGEEEREWMPPHTERQKNEWNPGSDDVYTRAAGAIPKEEERVEDDDYDYTIDNSIDQIGWGKFQLKLLIVVAAAKGCMAMQLLLNAFNLHELHHEWHLSRFQRTVMGGAMFLGMMLGSSFWGAMSDKYGRKKVFVITIINTSVIGCMASFCPEYYSYTVCRLLLGFGMGGMGPVSVALLIEFTPSYCRGYASGLVWVGYYVGEVIQVILGSWFHWGQDGSWRNLVVVTSMVPLLIILVWMLGIVDIPESPRYLLIAGKQQEGWDMLAEAANQNRSILFRQKLIHHTTSTKWIGATETAKRGSIAMLFHPSLRLTTILLWIIWFVAGYGMYGMLFLLPRFFHRKTDMTIGEEHWVMLITAAGAMLGVGTGAIMSEVQGRKPAFVIGFTGAGICVMALNAESPLVVTILFATVIRFFTGVYEAVWYTYTPEVYPTSVRSIGVGTCATMAKVAGMISPLVSEVLMSGPAGSGATYRATGVSMAAFLCGTCAALMLPIETKGRGMQDYIGDDQGGQFMGANDAWSFQGIWKMLKAMLRLDSKDEGTVDANAPEDTSSSETNPLMQGDNEHKPHVQ